jgi:hypothetical protein
LHPKEKIRKAEFCHNDGKFISVENSKQSEDDRDTMRSFGTSDAASFLKNNESLIQVLVNRSLQLIRRFEYFAE